MVEFVFKWSNLNSNGSIRRQHLTFAPPALAVGGSVSGTAWAVASGPTPTHAVPPDPTRRQRRHPLGLPALPEVLAVVSDATAPVGTSLMGMLLYTF
jgi:hypothetical protein